MHVSSPFFAPMPVRFVFALAACILAGATDPAQPRPYRLFMGSNLSVVGKESSFHVRDVRDDAFVVTGPKGDVVIPARDSEFRLKIDDTLKLTADVATVENLVFDRAYSPEADPMKKFADAARASTYLGESNDAADASLRMAQIGVGFNQGAMDSAAAAGAHPEVVAMAARNLAVATAQQGQAEDVSRRAQSMNAMDVFSSVSTSNRMTDEIAAEAFDALRVTFNIAAPRPLRTPYVVIFMKFLAQKDRPDTSNVWIYAEKLPDLDEHPRSVTIFRGGFPPGYQIDSYHLHFYEGYAEIATNISRKVVALTTDEAFQYSVIQHITANRSRTQAPAKASFFWPADLSSRFLPDKLSRTLYVKVTKTGHATGIYEDDACRQPVADAEIAALAPELHFLPALDNGKPVEGVAAVKLGPRN